MSSAGTNQLSHVGAATHASPILTGRLHCQPTSPGSPEPHRDTRSRNLAAAGILCPSCEPRLNAAPPSSPERPGALRLHPSSAPTANGSRDTEKYRINFPIPPSLTRVEATTLARHPRHVGAALLRLEEESAVWMRLRPCANLGTSAEGAERLRCTQDPAGRSWSGGGAVAERDSLVP
ncbi:hypothetical protein NDU88_003769 [Pleurodeles waltl]|uniref:Uncharacterized protein n=1 Tax=Pleurodeles waltl TaxID=8319 RepID=A0AAV7PAJ7_PLEWA|nr:hypothetical protein NDU88_003769 [Pleurodeles waltl]